MIKPRRTLVTLTDVADPDIDLVAVPFAGGSPSAYLSWANLLPESWRLTAVQLPGRGSRYGEEFHQNVGEAAAEIAANIAERAPCRLILFGHSVGSLLSLEVAKLTEPLLLAVAGCTPPVPGRPAHDNPATPDEITQMTRDALVSAGVHDAAMLDQLTAINTSIFAADMALLSAHAPAASLLGCDIVAYYGADDDVPVGSWARWTTGLASTVGIPGSHYFIQESAELVIADLLRRVSATSLCVSDQLQVGGVLRPMSLSMKNREV